MKPIPWRLRWWWFKHKRRRLEAKLYTMGALGPWERVWDENQALGVWLRDRRRDRRALRRNGDKWKERI